MKKTMLFVLMVVSMNIVADSTIIADLKEYNRLGQFDPKVPFSERAPLMREIKARVTPVIDQEFAKLADGGITPLMRDLLNDPDAAFYARVALGTQLPTYSSDIQTNVLKKAFEATPDSLRVELILSLWRYLPKEAFAGKEIQEWLVGKINGGMPAGVFYFILTEESAEAVSKAANSSMKRFSRKRENSENNLFSLLSAVFLASRGDEGALKHLDSLLDKRDLDSLLDTAYVIHAAAMSGNEKLIQKIRDIVATDKRSRWKGENAMPPELSFAQIAASVLSLTIDGFPSVGYWSEYDDETKKKVHDWLINNPTYSIKPDSIRLFFQESPFRRIVSDMSHNEKDKRK